jgi:hypothetical protein
MVMSDLCQADLITQIHTDKEKLRAFMPAQDVNRYSLKYVIETLDKRGNNRILQKPAEEMQTILHIQERFLQQIENAPENILIQDLPTFEIKNA